jgi:hypothetical protein
MCQAFQAMSGISAEVGLVQFLRRGSVNSTGLTSSGAGLHRAGPINSDQYCSSSATGIRHLPPLTAGTGGPQSFPNTL